LRGRTFVVGFVALGLAFVAGLTVSLAENRVHAADADGVIERFALDAGERVPLMRIGFAPAHAIEVSSRGSFRLLDPLTGRTVWRESFQETLAVVAEGGPKKEVPTVFRIQVGAFSDRKSADAELDRLTRAVGVTGIVHHDPDRGTWRVRMGRADDRQALGPLVDELRGIGMADVWIAEEPATTVKDVSLRFVDRSYESQATALRRVVVVPAGRAPIMVEGKPYRGVVELRVTESGTVRPINWVGLETYLLGVVPAELGPEVWPQIEALKAQAVAARTYAWRNRGQFASDGYDLCATPRCQVYSGRSVEHPMSDRAVHATRGQVMKWQGRPIIALYTATCGGHTEDGREVFADHDEPYLAGVPCRAEHDALATLRGTVTGSAVAPIVDESGTDVTRDWALLVASGVVRSPTSDRGRAVAPVSADGLRELTSAMAERAGLPAPVGDARPAEGLGTAATALLTDLGWSERATLLLDGEDLAALLRDSETLALPEDQRRALAYLAWVEALWPFGDGRFHVEDPPSAARLAPSLVRIGETYQAFGLREAVVSGVGRNNLRLIQGKGEIRLPLGSRPHLFALAGGRAVPSESLEIWPGDRVRFRTGDDGSIDFLEVIPPVKGVSDDRVSAVYSWEVRKTRRQLEAAVSRRVSVGRLRDLEILRRGVSGRIAEMRVTGTRGETVVRGFDIRQLLGLRESLTVIEIQRDASGEIVAAVFAGKGWGHGVGLCQVGAYGMALRGVDYEGILTHYYSGATLSRIDLDGP